jgi:hypothetical protein
MPLLMALNENQIILTQDPTGLANPWGSDTATSMCFNASEWIATQHAFKDVSVQFGYICLAIGIFFGALYMYLYLKYKETKKPKRKHVRKVKDGNVSP